MAKTSLQKFCKSHDRYAKKVSLSYKKKGSFETSIGGACSILQWVLLSYWVAINVIFTFKPPGDFKTSTSIKLVQESDGLFPTYAVNGEQLLLAYSAESTTYEDLSTDELNKYVIGIWFQQ